MLIILQIIISIILIGLILLQTGQGGLQSGVGGEFYRTKRGAERIVFTATIIFSGLFLIISIVNLMLR